MIEMLRSYPKDNLKRIAMALIIITICFFMTLNFISKSLLSDVFTYYYATLSGFFQFERIFYKKNRAIPSDGDGPA
jgi:hypothetical protein